MTLHPNDPAAEQPKTPNQPVQPPAPPPLPQRSAATSGYPAPSGPGQPYINPPAVLVVASKSAAVAYILWFLLGNLGIHKFYLRQTGLGVLYLILGVVGWATSWLFFGFLFLGVLWLMMIIDLFLIPGWVRELNRRDYQAMSRGSYGPTHGPA